MILSSSLYIGAGYYIYHQSAWDSSEGFSITLISLLTFQFIRVARQKFKDCMGCSKSSLKAIDLMQKMPTLFHWTDLMNGLRNSKTSGKVEKTLKVSQDLISSPSRSHKHLNFYFLFFWQNIAGRCQQTFCSKNLLTAPINVLALHPKPTFPPKI